MLTGERSGKLKEKIGRERCGKAHRHRDTDTDTDTDTVLLI